LLTGPEQGFKRWLQILFAGERCLLSLTIEDIMRGVLEGHLALKESGLEGNPHTHGDSSDALVNIAKVLFDTLRDFQPSSLFFS
jgi:hypothetical protein